MYARHDEPAVRHVPDLRAAEKVSVTLTSLDCVHAHLDAGSDRACSKGSRCADDAQLRAAVFARQRVVTITIGDGKTDSIAGA